ncbi:hypothetical protein F5880DRAFT_1640843 [Lentinula raphanica]|nr:hypothetical protein F5880DRAFT_1640843 [Lentinula raphanica]
MNATRTEHGLNYLAFHQKKSVASGRYITLELPCWRFEYPALGSLSKWKCVIHYPAEAGGFVSTPDKKLISCSPAVCRSSEATASEPSRSAGLRRAVALPAEAFAFDGNKQNDVPQDRAVVRWIHQRRSKQDQAVDMEMYSPDDASGVDSSGMNNNCVPLVNDIYITDNSPTPGLTYSPTSTESSSGIERYRCSASLTIRTWSQWTALPPQLVYLGNSQSPRHGYILYLHLPFRSLVLLDGT